jgi:UDP-glucose 4-epimerase
MNILVTGGAGYAGTELVASLVRRKEVNSVTVYDSLSRSNRQFFLSPMQFPREKIRFVQADILDTRRLRTETQKADVIYHLAACVITPFSDDHPHLFEQINHWGTAEMVYAAEQSSCSRFIYLSSASVYGASDAEVSSQTVPNPSTHYGISKLRGEEHVTRLLEKMSGHIIRCGNIYGYNPSMRFDAVMNRMAFDAHYKGRISIHGSGEQKRAFIQVNKVAQVLSALLSEDIPAKIADLVEHNLTMNQLAEAYTVLYPKLERLYTNRHMPMRQISVQPDKLLNNLIRHPRMLSEELEDMRKRFSFEPA